MSSFLDRVDCAFYRTVGKHNFNLKLGQEVDHVLRTAVEFRVSALAPEAFGFNNGHSLQTNLLQRLLNIIQFERFDDRLNFLHGPYLPAVWFV